MAPKGKTASKAETGANLGFEAKLWQMADGLRNNMDAAEYKHVVLGLEAEVGAGLCLRCCLSFRRHWSC